MKCPLHDLLQAGRQRSAQKTSEHGDIARGVDVPGINEHLHPESGAVNADLAPVGIQFTCCISDPKSFRSSVTAASSRVRASTSVCPCSSERLINDMVVARPRVIVVRFWISVFSNQ